MNLSGITIWSTFGGYMVNPVDVTFNDHVSYDDFTPIDMTCTPGRCSLDAWYGTEIANSTRWTFSGMSAGSVDTNWFNWNPEYLSCTDVSCTIAFENSVYFDTYSQSDSFVLTFSPAIPEPSALLMFALGLSCLCRRFRA